MKTKNIIISLVLAMVTMLSAQAQTLTIDNVSAQTGGELELTVKGSNVSSYIATGFYVELPNGFSAAGVTATKGSGLQSDHVVKAGMTSDTKLRVAIYSTKNAALSIATSSSPLCTLKLSAPSKAGTYTGRITGVEFSNASHSLSAAATKTFTITVVNNTPPVLGDVNNDQRVSLADITTIFGVMNKSWADPTFVLNADVDGNGKVNVADVASVITIMAGGSITPGGHSDTGGAPAGVEAVDLGLPSGTKWANMNVGAETPVDYGDYFAWGETKPKEVYSSDTYLYYQNDLGGNISGDSRYDAARANWGGQWRMPTLDDINELLDNTTVEQVTVNGVSGRKLTSKTNGNSIFFPDAGWHYNSDLYYVGTYGVYWSSTLVETGSNSARRIFFYSGGVLTGSDSRFLGVSVRPVQ